MTNVIFAGAPNSGKTTALAALYYLMTHGDDSSVKLARHPSQAEYLDILRKAWEKAEPVPRTKLDIQRVHLDVKSGDISSVLNFPDVSGETFFQMLETDKASTSLVDDMKDADLLLFFVHSKINKPKFLHSKDSLDGNLKATSPTGKTSEATGLDESEIRRLPTDTLAVEMLRRLTALAKRPRQLRILLVVSAYDRVSNEDGADEGAWVRMNLPLTWQYLEGTWKGQYGLVGLSAQGGAYERAAAKEALLDLPDASKRPWMVQEGKRSQDICRLISVR